MLGFSICHCIDLSSHDHCLYHCPELSYCFGFFVESSTSQVKKIPPYVCVLRLFEVLNNVCVCLIPLLILWPSLFA